MKKLFFKIIAMLCPLVASAAIETNHVSVLYPEENDSMDIYMRKLLVLIGNPLTDTKPTNFIVQLCPVWWTNGTDATAITNGCCYNGSTNTLAPPICITGVVASAGGSFTLAAIEYTDTNTWAGVSNRFWLYNTTNVTWYSNRAIMGAWITNSVARVATVDTYAAPLTIVTNGDSSYTFLWSLDIDGACAANDTNLFFYPEMRSATATPGAGQLHFVKFKFKRR